MTQEVLERYELVKAMHLIVTSLNDETAYYDWINIVPDEATNEDLLDCAMRTEVFKDCCSYFAYIMRHYYNGGLYLALERKVYDL